MVPAFTSPRAAAEWWIDQGFSPVPIPTMSKNPGKLHTKWQDLRIDATNVAQFFNGKVLNIGILLGLGDAADADLDWPEAEAIAPAYLPPTGMVWGHGATPRSHYLYRSPDAVTKQFRDPLQPDEKKPPVAELRARKTDHGIGLQTVVPPGLHHTGEKIEFASADAPAIVPPDVLLGALSKIAAGALLGHYWPAHGRHDAMLALSGILARAGWAEKDAAKFCRELYAAVPTHDPAQVHRSDSEIVSTYEKFAAGEEITGFPSLAKVIDQRVIVTALDWLGIKTQVADWRAHLIRAGEDGPPLRLLANACIAFREAPELAGALGYDEFAGRAVALRPTPWRKSAGPLTDDDDLHATEWLHHQGICVATKTATEAAQAVAGENRYHPPRDYLRSLVWDETVRLDSWLSTYFGVTETPYSRAVGSRWLIAGVARIFEPGCRADQVLVLHGAQGIEKSSGLRAIAGDQWFSDHLSTLGNKDARQEMQGVWIIEISELSALRRAEVEQVKNFISTRVDHFRPSYGRRALDYPRQCVFAATSNADRPFTDETGNRRFWSVDCGRVEVGGLTRDRDQLWAEALVRFRASEPWWFESPELISLAESEQRQRYEHGSRDDLIERWIENPHARELEQPWDTELPWLGSEQGKINITDVLVHGLGIEPPQIRPADAREVGRFLRFLRYTQVQERSGKFRGTRFFVAPASPLEKLAER